jgi:ribosomal protein L32
MVVRMRRNRSQTAKRRSHHRIIATRLLKCDCGALRQNHRACKECGKYNGQVVIDVVAEAKRSARRKTRKEKELRASGQQTESEKETNKELASAK